MILRKFIAAVSAAAVIAGTVPLCAAAEWQAAEENSESSYSSYDYDVTAVTVTTAPAADYDPRQSAGNEVTQTWAAATTAKPDKLIAPARVYIGVGEVKDGKVKVKLNIESESRISNASLSLSYDNMALEYEGFEPSEKAGGTVIENVFTDKFVYNYVNAEGSEHSGTYATLTFKIVDENAKSTVVYVNVNSLDNEEMEPIPYSTDNGIVVLSEEEAVTEKASYEGLPVIEAHYTKEPIDPSDLGLAKVKYMVFEDDYVAAYREGMLLTLKQGETRIEITYSDNTKERVLLKVLEPEEKSSEAVEAIAEVSEAESAAESEPEKTVLTEEEHTEGPNRKALYIMIAVAAAIVALIIEYIVIMKPFGRKAKRVRHEEKPEEPGDNREMLAELEKAIAAKNARENERRMEEGIASTAEINSVLVGKGFKITEDGDDEE